MDIILKNELDMNGLWTINSTRIRNREFTAVVPSGEAGLAYAQSNIIHFACRTPRAGKNIQPVTIIRN